MICVRKNEAVCCEVQTHFGSFRLSGFIKKILGAIPRFVRPKMKLFAVEFRRILEVLCLQVFKKKLWAQFHDLCVPQTKLFAVRFRCILDVLCLQVLQKTFLVQFQDLCVQERSCLT